MNDLTGFDYRPRTRIVFGAGAVERLGELARELGLKKVLLVSDPGVAAAGHVEAARKTLDAAKVGVAVFDRVIENPTTREVDACVEAAKKAGIDGIVGLGGGSSMDTAKGCNFLLTNGGKMQDYRGIGKAAKPMLPLIAVPTTAGTGSECQSFALIADAESHQKMACGDAKAAAAVAILDPKLTLSQPPQVTACTGIDAVAHALETAVTTRRTELSWLYSREAFTLTLEALPLVLRDPGDLDARGRMLLGAAYAGTAIENSMLGAAHSAANPLTARFGVVHGLAVGLMLPLVVRFNSKDPAARMTYAELAALAGLLRRKDHPDTAIGALVERLDWLLNFAGIPSALADCGVNRDAIPALAKEAAEQWTAQFNPRRVDASDFTELFEAAFHKRGEGDGGLGPPDRRTEAAPAEGLAG